MSDEPLTWVVGAGGLLGSSVVARGRLTGHPIWSPDARIPWSDRSATEHIRRAAEAFLSETAGVPWQVCWCAGAAVTGSTTAELAAERQAFDALVDVLGRAATPEDGALFLTSSAGGVYAGSAGSPRDELTTPRAIGPYGRSKLELESRASQLARETGVKVLVGRVSNLYGPAQNLAKPQGLISHIARAHLLGQPISIYVPLDTMRDYLFVSDAARLVLAGLARLRGEVTRAPESVVVKVLASQQSVTVGFLISEFRRITQRPARVVYGASSAAAYQVRDLRLHSRVWTELDSKPVVPLPVGIHRVILAMSDALRAGALR
jgi:UDP-glucose 4-epimerase